MKSLLLIATMIAAPMTFAADKPIATGSVELHSAPRSFEVVIDGAAAEKLFATLDAPVSTTGEWRNKISRSIVCGQNMRTQQYACSLSVDESGVQ